MSMACARTAMDDTHASCLEFGADEMPRSVWGRVHVSACGKSACAERAVSKLPYGVISGLMACEMISLSELTSLDDMASSAAVVYGSPHASSTGGAKHVMFIPCIELYILQ